MYTILIILGCIVAWKVFWRLYHWNDRAIKRRDAQRAVAQLDAALVDARRRTPPPPPPSFPTWPAKDPDYSHIPRIAFDLDTQVEFGGSRYHTWYVDPEYAAEAGIQPGVYITDKRTGPTRIGEPETKRVFIPYDQVIHR